MDGHRVPKFCIMINIGGIQFMCEGQGQSIKTRDFVFKYSTNNKHWSMWEVVKI